MRDTTTSSTKGVYPDCSVVGNTARIVITRRGGLLLEWILDARQLQLIGRIAVEQLADSCEMAGRNTG